MELIVFAIIFIFGALGAAVKGDFSGVAIIGKIIIGIIVFFVVGGFLAATGWGGLFLILGISLIVAFFSTN